MANTKYTSDYHTEEQYAAFKRIADAAVTRGENPYSGNYTGPFSLAQSLTDMGSNAAMAFEMAARYDAVELGF